MPYTPPKYTPNTAAGQIRRRIWRVGAENPNSLEVSIVPYMSFHEEEAIMLEDASSERGLTKVGGSLVLRYDPAKTVPLKNPSDDAALTIPGLGSSIPMSLAFAILYSLGRLAQADRDASETARIAAQEAGE